MYASIDVIFNHFGRHADTLDATVETALDAGVVACIATADPLTRRDTGALVANKAIESGSGHRAILWLQGYAVFQNFGTYKMSGTHFANAGADAALPVIEAQLGRWPG